MKSQMHWNPKAAANYPRWVRVFVNAQQNSLGHVLAWHVKLGVIDWLSVPSDTQFDASNKGSALAKVNLSGSFK
jgi:hypothetical protein